MPHFQRGSARVSRVSAFEASDGLKFTAAEQGAIQAAELSFGHGSQARASVQPPRRTGLWALIALALAILLSPGN
jgi:hypothetical protein